MMFNDEHISILVFVLFVIQYFNRLLKEQFVWKADFVQILKCENKIGSHLAAIVGII